MNNLWVFFYQEGSCAEQPTRWPGTGGRSVFSLWAMFLQICVCICSFHSNCCNGQILNYCTSLTASQVSYIIYTWCLPKPCSGSICTVLCNTCNTSITRHVQYIYNTQEVVYNTKLSCCSVCRGEDELTLIIRWCINHFSDLMPWPTHFLISSLRTWCTVGDWAC